MRSDTEDTAPQSSTPNKSLLGKVMTLSNGANVAGRHEEGTYESIRTSEDVKERDQNRNNGSPPMPSSSGGGTDRFLIYGGPSSPQELLRLQHDRHHAQADEVNGQSYPPPSPSHTAARDGSYQHETQQQHPSYNTAAYEDIGNQNPSACDDLLYSLWFCCCHCWRKPLRGLTRRIRNAESLHRSFCHGAIDGMLTGSSITAASVGLGLFDPLGSITTRLTIVSLVLASCAADGLCMGLGHVWSTYVAQDAAAREWEEELATFRHRRGVSKAKLVDMLLSRGMLKIDAMSVADTLEGYPDIFLSAVLGDAHLQGPLGLAHGGDSRVASSTALDGGGGGLDDGAALLPGGETHQQYYYNNNGDGGGGVDAMAAQPPLSIYDVTPEDEDESSQDDPASRAVVESKYEGVVMMIAFSSFALLPSLIHGFIPSFVEGHLGGGSAAPQSVASHNEEGPGDDMMGDSAMSATSLTVTLASVIMLLLGIWKSKFSSSSWILTGMETVLVLILCVASAFFLGALFKSLIHKWSLS